MQPLWGFGHIHHETVIGMDSPSIRNAMISLSYKNDAFSREEISTLKLWKVNRREKSIMIDKIYRMKALTISMHPSGHIFAINFEKEIKLMSIVSD